jgi:hypothetical protein
MQQIINVGKKNRISSMLQQINSRPESLFWLKNPEEMTTDMQSKE